MSRWDAVRARASRWPGSPDRGSAAPETRILASAGPSALPPLDLRLLDVLRPAVDAGLHRWFRVEEFGRDRLPEGPALLAVNHLSNLDGPLVVALLPHTLALAKDDLYHGPLGWFLDHVGQIPVDRSLADVHAVKRCLQVLQSGHRLAIFPEAHRGHGDFSHFRPGVAYLAMVTGVPVVPVALFGTRPYATHVSTLPERGDRISVVYGDPIAVPQVPWPRRPDAVAAEARRLQELCRQHVVEAAREADAELPMWPAPPRPPDKPRKDRRR